MMVETDDNDRFADLIQDLPQELRDEILDYTLAVPTRSIIVVDKAWALPVCLHFTKATRNKSAEAYYGTNAFSFASAKRSIRWINLLAPLDKERAKKARSHHPGDLSALRYRYFKRCLRSRSADGLGERPWKIFGEISIWRAGQSDAAWLAYTIQRSPRLGLVWCHPNAVPDELMRS